MNSENQKTLQLSFMNLKYNLKNSSSKELFFYGIISCLTVFGKFFTKFEIIPGYLYLFDLLLFVNVLLCLFPLSNFRNNLLSFSFLILSFSYFIGSIFLNSENIVFVVRQYFIFYYFASVLIIFNKLFSKDFLKRSLFFLVLISLMGILLQGMYFVYIYLLSPQDFYKLDNYLYFNSASFFCVFIYSAYVLVYEKSIIYKAIYFITILFFTKLFGHSSAVLALLVILPFYVLFNVSFRLKIIMIILGIASLITVKLISKDYNDNNSRWRIMYWTYCLDQAIYENKMIAGNGFGVPYLSNCQINELAYTFKGINKLDDFKERFIKTPHNSFLTLVYHVGLLPVVFFFLFSLRFFLVNFFKRKDSLDEIFLSILFVSCVVWVSFNVILELPHSSLFFWFVFYSLSRLPYINNEDKKSILFIVQLPPPIHGVSVVNKEIVSSEDINTIFKTEVINLGTAASLDEIGKSGVNKYFKLFGLYSSLLLKLVFTKIDTVYITLSPIGLGFLKDCICVFISKFFVNRVIIHLHGQGVQKTMAKNTVLKFFTKWCFYKTDVICLSEKLTYDVVNLTLNQIFILPNGIRINMPDEKKDFNTEKLNLLFLSNFFESKGILVYLDAIVLLKNNNVNFYANIVGNEADITFSKVVDFIKKNQLEDCVTLHGPLYLEDKLKQYKLNQILIYPSNNDAYPLTILEALSQGVVVVATDEGAITDMVVANFNGLIISKNSPKEILNSVIYFNENKEELKLYSKNAIQHFNKVGSYTVFEKSLINILQK